MPEPIRPAPEHKAKGFWLLLFLLSFAIHAALNLRTLRHPGLHAEDGSILLERYWVAGSAGRVFETYNGYVVVGPNLLAWAVCRLPPTVIPFGMVLVSVCLYAAAICLLVTAALPAARRREVVFVTGVLSALALGNAALSGSLMYSQCSFLMILLGLLWRALHARVGLACGLVVHLCLWSHPLGVLLIAFFLARWVLSRAVGNRIFWCSTIASACAYWWFGTEGMPPSARSTGPLDWLGYLGVRGFVELFLPTACKHAWYSPMPFVWAALAAAALAAWSVWILRERRARGPLASGGFSGSGLDLLVAFALPVASMVARPGLLSPADVWGQRYIFLSRCIVLLVLWSWASRTRFRRLAGGKVLHVAAVLYVVAIWCANRGYYKPNRAQAGEVAAFMQSLASLEAANPDGRSGVRAFLERGDWDINIAPR